MIMLGDDEDQAAIGGGIVTPGQIEAEMNSINAYVEALNRDVTAQWFNRAEKTAWVNRWRAFRKEWQAFYAGHKGLWSRMSGSTYDKALSFRSRVEEWAKEFQGTGGKIIGPKKLAAPVGPAGEPPGPSIFDRIRQLAIAGIVVLGVLYIAPFAVRQFQKSRREGRMTT